MDVIIQHHLTQCLEKGIRTVTISGMVLCASDDNHFDMLDDGLRLLVVSAGSRNVAKTFDLLLRFLDLFRHCPDLIGSAFQNLGLRLLLVYKVASLLLQYLNLSLELSYFL